MRRDGRRWLTNIEFRRSLNRTALANRQDRRREASANR